MTSPRHPELGIDPELLAQAARIDWHAGHHDVPHPTPVQVLAVVDGRAELVSHPCACDTWRVLALFTLRLVTGQAPMSTTDDGSVLSVAMLPEGTRLPSVPATRVVLASAHPDDLDPPVVTFTVHGRLLPAEDHEDCEPGCEHADTLVTGASVTSQEPLDAGNSLAVASTHLRDFIVAAHRHSAHGGQCCPSEHDDQDGH